MTNKDIIFQFAVILCRLIAKYNIGEYKVGIAVTHPMVVTLVYCVVSDIITVKSLFGRIFRL